MGKFFGTSTHESFRTQDSENVYERWVQQIFDPISVGRSWMSAKKWGPLAKLWGVTKKCISHNFRIWASKFKSLVAIDYGNKWFTFGSSNSKILGDILFCNASYFCKRTATCPKKISRWKFSGAEQFTKKFRFSLISLSVPPKKVSGSCTHNFDATDLPNS